MIYGYDIGRKPKNGRSRAVHRANLGHILIRPSEEFPGHKNLVIATGHNEVLLY